MDKISSWRLKMENWWKLLWVKMKILIKLYPEKKILNLGIGLINSLNSKNNNNQNNKNNDKNVDDIFDWSPTQMPCKKDIFEEESITTTGASYAGTDMIFKDNQNQIIRFEIRDTAGQEKYGNK